MKERKYPFIEPRFEEFLRKKRILGKFLTCVKACWEPEGYKNGFPTTENLLTEPLGSFPLHTPAVGNKDFWWEIENEWRIQNGRSKI